MSISAFGDTHVRNVENEYSHDMPQKHTLKTLSIIQAKIVNI